MEPQVGKCYSIKRITGQVVEFKLLGYEPKKRCFDMELFGHQGQMTIDSLTDAEMQTLKEIAFKGVDTKEK
ncbi:MAG: hypothetical protein JST26_05790 [Bacteroidetes bacterium]|nr:hypothetical protein [Bacteroidota bacterium]